MKKFLIIFALAFGVMPLTIRAFADASEYEQPSYGDSNPPPDPEFIHPPVTLEPPPGWHDNDNNEQNKDDHMDPLEGSLQGVDVNDNHEFDTPDFSDLLGNNSRDDEYNGPGGYDYDLDNQNGQPDTDFDNGGDCYKDDDLYGNNGDRDDNNTEQQNGESGENGDHEPTPLERLSTFAEHYEGTPQIGATCMFEALVFVYNFFGNDKDLGEVALELVREFNNPFLPIIGVELSEMENYFNTHFEYEILSNQDGLIEALEEGHPVLASLSYGDIDNDGHPDGHEVIIYGYEIDSDGNYLFLYYDPQEGSDGYCAGFGEFMFFIEIIDVKN